MSTSIATRSTPASTLSSETLETLKALRDNAQTLELAGKPLRYATLPELAFAIGASIYELTQQSGDVPEDARRAAIISDLVRAGFVTFLEEVLVPVTNLADSEFARFTLSVNVKRWLGDEDDRQKQDEQEESHGDLRQGPTADGGRPSTWADSRKSR